MTKIRTRFAPSPTGDLHVGGLRTALFAWLLAKQNDGQFILRIEDTDKQREEVGSLEQIQESLKWLGLDWDEGPTVGGDHGPYLQSERLEIYHEFAEKLITAGHAYVDPYTKEELEAFRNQAKADKSPFLFRNHRPDQSISWDKKQTLRFRVPKLKSYEWSDLVRGQLSAGEEALDDFVLIKADGYPTYNFAHVVDDHLMNITHVIRGEEFIASVPKFLSLMDALEIERPLFATVPPILGKSGGKKLSKRDGATSVAEYQEQGILSESLLNYLASLGWNDGTEQEVFSREELLNKFSLSRVQSSGARFDHEKLQWLNWQHLKILIDSNPKKLVEFLDTHTDFTKSQLSLENFDQVSILASTKASSLEEFSKQLAIFIDPNELDIKLLINDLSPDKDQIIKTLSSSITALEQLSGAEFKAELIQSKLKELQDESDLDPRGFFSSLRAAISRSKVSPSLFEMLEVLGPQVSLSRLKQTLDQLQ